MMTCDGKDSPEHANVECISVHFNFYQSSISSSSLCDTTLSDARPALGCSLLLAGLKSSACSNCRDKALSESRALSRMAGRGVEQSGHIAHQSFLEHAAYACAAAQDGTVQVFHVSKRKVLVIRTRGTRRLVVLLRQGVDLVTHFICLLDGAIPKPHGSFEKRCSTLALSQPSVHVIVAVAIRQSLVMLLHSCDGVAASNALDYACQGLTLR